MTTALAQTSALPQQRPYSAEENMWEKRSTEKIAHCIVGRGNEHRGDCAVQGRAPQGIPYGIGGEHEGHCMRQS